MRAAYSVTAKATDVLGQCSEGMFEPGLANLFEPSLLFAPPLIRYRFCGMTGWSLFGN